MAIWVPIPGETPIDDLSGLKIKGITTRSELNYFEAQNVSRAVLKYLSRKPSHRLAPFDLSWSLKLHREMFGDVWDWAGETRKSDKNFGVHWEQTASMLLSLLDDLASWSGFQMELAEQAVLLHHRAVQIHPFENGNGRWSRLLSNIWLKRNGHPLVEWPEAHVGTESPIRAEYLDAIREADAGKYCPLRELHRRLTPSM